MKTMENKVIKNVKFKNVILLFILIFTLLFILNDFAYGKAFQEASFLNRYEVYTGGDNYFPATDDYPFTESSATSIAFPDLYGSSKDLFEYYGEIPYTYKDSDNSDSGSKLSSLRVFNGKSIHGNKRLWSSMESQILNLNEGDIVPESEDPHIKAMTITHDGSTGKTLYKISNVLFQITSFAVKVLITLKSINLATIFNAIDSTGKLSNQLASLFLVNPDTGHMSPLLVFAIALFIFSLVALAFKILKGALGGTSKKLLNEFFILVGAIAVSAIYLTGSNALKVGSTGINICDSLANNLATSASSTASIFTYSTSNLQLDTVSTQKALIEKMYVDQWIYGQFGYAPKDLDIIEEDGSGSDLGTKDEVLQAIKATFGNDAGINRFKVCTSNTYTTGNKVNNLGYWLYAANSSVKIYMGTVGGSSAFYNDNGKIAVKTSSSDRTLFVVDFLSNLRQIHKNNGRNDMVNKIDTIMTNLDQPNYSAVGGHLILISILNVTLCLALFSITLFCLIGELIVIAGGYCMVVMPLLMLFKSTRGTAKKLLWTYVLAFLRYLVGAALFNTILVVVVLMVESASIGNILVAAMICILMFKLSPSLLAQLNMAFNSISRGKELNGVTRLYNNTSRNYARRVEKKRKERRDKGKEAAVGLGTALLMKTPFGKMAENKMKDAIMKDAFQNDGINRYQDVYKDLKVDNEEDEENDIDNAQDGINDTEENNEKADKSHKKVNVHSLDQLSEIWGLDPNEDKELLLYIQDFEKCMQSSDERLSRLEVLDIVDKIDEKDPKLSRKLKAIFFNEDGTFKDLDYNTARKFFGDSLTKEDFMKLKDFMNAENYKILQGKNDIFNDKMKENSGRNNLISTEDDSNFGQEGSGLGLTVLDNSDNSESNKNNNVNRQIDNESIIESDFTNENNGNNGKYNIQQDNTSTSRRNIIDSFDDNTDDLNDIPNTTNNIGNNNNNSSNSNKKKMNLNKNNQNSINTTDKVDDKNEDFVILNDDSQSNDTNTINNTNSESINNNSSSNDNNNNKSFNNQNKNFKTNKNDVSNSIQRNNQQQSSNNTIINDNNDQNNDFVILNDNSDTQINNNSNSNNNHSNQNNQNLNFKRNNVNTQNDNNKNNTAPKNNKLDYNNYTTQEESKHIYNVDNSNRNNNNANNIKETGSRQSNEINYNDNDINTNNINNHQKNTKPNNSNNRIIQEEPRHINNRNDIDRHDEINSRINDSDANVTDSANNHENRSVFNRIVPNKNKVNNDAKNNKKYKNNNDLKFNKKKRSKVMEDPDDIMDITGLNNSTSDNGKDTLLDFGNKDE